MDALIGDKTDSSAQDPNLDLTDQIEDAKIFALALTTLLNAGLFLVDRTPSFLLPIRSKPFDLLVGFLTFLCFLLASNLYRHSLPI